LSAKTTCDLKPGIGAAQRGELMRLSGAAQIFAVACFGGALGELLKWYRLRESENFPVYARRIRYWALTLAMVLAGGGLALMYGTDPKNALMVMNIGLSAPLIVKAIAESQPTDIPTGGIRTPGYGMNEPLSGGGGVRRFLSWR
jgi:hypothetical protein